MHEPRFAAEDSLCCLQTGADHRKHAELQLLRQSPAGDTNRWIGGPPGAQLVVENDVLSHCLMDPDI